MRSRLPTFPPWTVPIALLVLCAISYGLFIPVLGFFWDDWPLILTGQLHGADGFGLYWQFDRPLTAWTYELTFPLLGADPLKWQIFSLLLRWATAVAMWWVLRLLWPRRQQEAAWASLLFAVYPVFKQQLISVTYSQHWMGFLLYFLSTGAMIQAYRLPRWRWPLTGFALAASLLQMVTMEYFLGLELLRPVFLWVLIVEKPGRLGERLKSVLGQWAPYLLALVAFVAWRLFFIDLPGEDRNAPVLLSQFLSSPLATAVQFAQMMLQDVSHILVSNWFTTVEPDIFVLTSPASLFALGIGLISAAVLAGYLISLGSTASLAGEACPNEALHLILLGGLLVVLAPLPAWVTERQVVVGAYSDRLAIPAMFGASLLLAGLTAWLIRGRLRQVALICLLVGLSVGNHIRIANDFRWARIQQNRLIWQLAWRAPGIAPSTAIFAEAEVLPKTGLYSTASIINLFYAGHPAPPALPYWFFSLSREFNNRMPELVAGMTLEDHFRQFTFTGHSPDSLVIYYQPAEADCLRILTPQDARDPALSPLLVQALPVSNLSRVQAETASGSTAQNEVTFGPEPEHGWCYYFEKADLARQMRDWQQVAALADQARDLGFSLENSESNTPQEWIPIIEGYALTGRWSEARDLSETILERRPEMIGRLCDTWSFLRQETAPGEEAGQVLQAFGCEK